MLILRCTIKKLREPACNALLGIYIRLSEEEVCMDLAKLDFASGLNFAAVLAALGFMAAIVLGVF